ncbi:adenylosuccinate synthetase [Variovorax ginsengisoli]|uniref:Adenylosuccinate synthetase n=1 Tax=Variovorax ginsengisoli TaxID=363844 RepID=A0ABT9S6R2_9BURK|nr:adenylosuccinate synthetase [Variovorax ginsengisoli]MDP9900051.1 adenylosuccinate synthase [Variovorax ginsengisoli]
MASGLTRYLSLLGLGFGDCGKGLFTDHLCDDGATHTVVRFNGGAQAGHNVVRPDGRHHTFSQFGAGSFHHGVATVLASPVVVHPTGLLAENEYLRRAGMVDAMSRLWIDARCKVTTPFHQAAGRLREWARGPQAHGSCGVGVGETVRHALAHPEAALRYGDLPHRAHALGKLDAIRTALQQEFAEVTPGDKAGFAERALLGDADLAARWLDALQPCIAQSPPAEGAAIAQRLTLPGRVVFEGAQGVLLDEWHGFHPHTTWSSISTHAVDAVLSDLGIDARVQHLGVLRSYLTRHGAGPLPTADLALDALAEPHNADAGWQGRFRRGHPDAVLLRYALKSVGPLDGLLVSHLDAIDTAAGLHWCESYETADVETSLTTLPWQPAPDLAHQQALTALLQRVTPRYERQRIASALQWIDRAQTISGLQVLLGSFGPTTAHVQRLSGPVSWWL